MAIHQLATNVDALELHLATGASAGELFPVESASRNTGFLWQSIYEATAMVNSRIERQLSPVLKTITVGIDALYDPRLLRLPESVLEVVSISGGGGSPVGLIVNTARRFLVRTDADWTMGLRDRVTITGYFAYHTDAANAWDMLDTITVDDSAAEFMVADASLYARGDIIRAADELMLVQDKDEDTNQLTVLRAINGTTAAAYTSEPLAVYRQMTDIAQITREVAAYVYKNRHRVNEVFSVPGGTVQVGALASDIWKTIDHHHPENANEHPYQ